MSTLTVPTMLHRPQPLGVLPYPAGLLLLPADASPEGEGALRAWLGGTAATDVPPAWRFFAAAAADDAEGAMQALAGDESPLAAYNRFVLTGDPSARATVQREGDETLRTLGELVAFIQGAADVPPDGAALDGELLAHALLARAAWHLERGEGAAAAETLTEGVPACRAASPLLAAQLVSQRAQIEGESDAAVALLSWREAAHLTDGAPESRIRADIALGYAMALHEGAGMARQRLVEAVKWYQEALHAGITLASAPDTYALIQNNLGLAYAQMPMSDAGEKLRLGVAVQSFREALKVYTREQHPEQWASTMLNMANALQYLPSSHPQENLIEAVNAYEDLMSVRTRAYDPVGYARLLANQGNALAHLGMFSPALEKLNEAHKLLHWHGEGESAAAILEQVERVNARVVATSDATPAKADEETR